MKADFPGQLRLDTCRTPEQRLMLAVLEDALTTYERGLTSSNPMTRRAFLETETWLRDHDSDSVFSFENICTTLQIDPDYLRGAMVQMKRKAFAGRTPANATVRRVRREQISDRRVWRGRVGQFPAAARK